MQKAALVFDLDGTLVDSLLDLRAALNVMLRGLGRRGLGPNEVRQMIGDGTRALVPRALKATGSSNVDLEAAHEIFLEAYQASLANLSRLYPGVETTLKSLHDAGRRLGICTNKQQAATLAVLQAFKIDKYFDAIFGGDVVQFRKPDPRHLLAVIDRLAVTPNDTVMIGDSENDYSAARAAGTAVILMRYGYRRVPPETLAPDAWLDQFADIPSTLDRISADR
jgi:phosphoglycolate phosphatase